MADQLNINRTVLIILLLAILLALVITVIAVADFSDGQLIAKAVEGSGGIYGTIDHNISPWAIDGARNSRIIW